jgi:hypothetical protein
MLSQQDVRVEMRMAFVKYYCGDFFLIKTGYFDEVFG